MGFPVTINGNTYNESDFTGYGYKTALPSMINDTATAAGDVATDAATASAAASAASTAATNAAASYDSFDDRYLGSKTSDPTVDNDGNALLTGALYWKSTATTGMRVYNGSAWESAGIPISSGLTTSDIGVRVQAYDADLTSWAAITPSAKQDAIGTISGVVKGNGANALTAATAGTDYAKPNVASSWTAAQTFDGGVIITDEVRETPTVANTSTAYTVTITNGTLFDLTLTGNCTFTFPTATAGRQFTILLKQDATGSRTVTWPSAVRWAGGTTPTITGTASKTDVISFVADGTYWLGFVGGQNYTRA